MCEYTRNLHVSISAPNIDQHILTHLGPLLHDYVSDLQSEYNMKKINYKIGAYQKICITSNMLQMQVLEWLRVKKRKM